MNLINLFFEKLKEDNHCLLYNGSFSDDITGRVIELAEFNLQNQEEKTKIKKRVSYLMAECFQNIIRHGDKLTNEEAITKDPGFFMSRNLFGKYYITSGNLINNQIIPKLKGQLDQVNRLDKDELKSLYVKVMDEGSLSSKGGAGLGLIEMARKSGQRLDYSFDKYNEKSSIFYNQILLESEVKELANEKTKIDFSIELHKILIEEDILLLQKGDFSKESILPVLKIIENNIIHEYKDSSLMKVLYHVLVELLQNISIHGYSSKEFKEGIFSLSKSNGKYTISAGNYILNAEIENFKKHLSKINSLNKEELKDFYLHQLKYGEETEKGGAGIGIIDIARILTKKIEYSFKKVDDIKSFFTIITTI